MLNVRLVGDYLYGKLLLTRLSLFMLFMVSDFVLSFFPLDVLNEIWDLIESVPEAFPTYCFLILYTPVTNTVSKLNLSCASSKIFRFSKVNIS